MALPLRRIIPAALAALALSAVPLVASADGFGNGPEVQPRHQVHCLGIDAFGSQPGGLACVGVLRFGRLIHPDQGGPRQRFR